MPNAVAVDSLVMQREALEPLVHNQIPELEKSWLAFDARMTALMAVFQPSPSSPLTPELEEYEAKRDKGFIYVVTLVRNVLNHSLVDADIQHAKVLEPIVREFAGAYRREYGAETVLIDDFTAKLDAAAVAPHVTALHLDGAINVLKSFNYGFKLKYAERTQNDHDQKLKGTVKKLCAAASHALDRLARNAEHLADMTDDETTLGKLNQIASVMNAITEKRAEVLHRHLSNLSNKNENAEIPDVTLPFPPPEEFGE